LEKERRWFLRTERFGWVAEDFQDECAIADVMQIRLEYAPGRFVEKMYRCEVRTRGGKVWHLQSQHFAGIAQFEDKGEAYRDFIENLITRVASQQTQCQFVSGVSWVSWLFNSLFLCGSLCALALVVFFLWVAVGWWAILKMLIIAFFLPRAFLWVTRNRPQAFDPRQIPANLLP
jgi:Flp pilus assembly protein TadB